jgi:ABC-type transporter Mla subunit MlaD
MSTRTLRQRLGLLVILAAVGFALLVVMFGSLPGLFQRTVRYTVRFTEAPGLAEGAPVKRSGVRIGSVRDVILDEEAGIVRVRLAIDAKYRLRNNEQVILVTGLLGGDTSIDVVPRPVEEGQVADRSVIEPGAEVRGIRAASVNTLLRGAENVVPTTQETLNDIRKSMQRLERLAARMEKSVPIAEDTMREYRELAKDARLSIPDLQRTNEEVRALAQEARGAIPDARRASREIADLARDARQALPAVEQTTEEVRALSREMRGLVPVVRNNVEDVGALARTWTRVGEQADVLLQENKAKITRTIDDVQQAAQAMNEAAGRAARLFGDDNIRNVNRTLENAQKASEPLPRTSKELEKLIQDGNRTLQRLDSTLQDVQKAVRPLGDRSDRITRNADETLYKLNQTMDDVRALFRVLDRSNGTLRKLLTDTSLYNNLDNAAVMVARLVPRLDGILKDVAIFADKLARHPESLGLGGVVRPGSGLKNPPTPAGAVPPAPHGAPVIIAPMKPTYPPR